MHWSQSRLNFDPAKLHAIGVRHVYVLPAYSAGDWFCDEDTFQVRLEELRGRKAEVEKMYPDMQVHFFGYTSCHPEGHTRVPPIYQCQIDVDGNPREAFACLRDLNYRKTIVERYRKAAGAGFRRMFLDDDLKDALCFCPLHVDGFSKTVSRQTSREELACAFRDASGSSESVELRRKYIAFCRENLISLAREIEQAVHEANPKARLGACLPARRFQDLSGIACSDITAIFDTPQAPAFARLPGEHYSAVPPDMACSVGYHTYYDALLPDGYERAWEVTAVAGAPYQPKNPFQLVQESRISSLLGLAPTLWAWPEDFDTLHAWPRLLASETTPARQHDRDRTYLGIPVFVQPGSAHELALEEHLSDGIIKGYQALSLMGFPLRLSSDVRPEDDTVCLFGPQPMSVAIRAEQWLTEGRTLVLDLPAVRKLCENLPHIFRFSATQPAGAPSRQVSEAEHEVDHSVAGFPIGSVASIRGNGITPVTRIRDTSLRDVGIGIASARVDGGTAIILPFDLERISFWISRPFYRDILARELAPFRTGRLPYLRGNAFLQLVLFREGDAEDYLAINYSDCAVTSELRRADAEVARIDLEPFGVTRGRLDGHPSGFDLVK